MGGIMFKWLKRKPVIVETSKYKIIWSYSRDTRSYTRHTLYVNLVDATYYDPSTNILKNMSDYSEVIDAHRYISKDEYTKLIDTTIKNIPCNCKFGDGFKIATAHKYDISAEFKKMYPNYILEHHIHGRAFIYNKEYPDASVNVKINGIFKKKACLQCNTCLDDKHKLVHLFEEWIKKVNNKIEEYEKIINICEG